MFNTNTNTNHSRAHASSGGARGEWRREKKFSFGTSTALLSVLFLLASLGAASCAKRTRGSMTGVRVGHVEQGVASWYGTPFHGRATASGEVFDMHQLTAAHRRLPFDTVARIEHRGNRRSVEVRINDRGPFVGGRFLDLSREAAVQLGMLQEGTARVKLRVVRAPRAARFVVQVGSFTSQAAAAEFRERYRSRLANLRILANGSGFRVVTGGGTRDEAEREQREARRLGIADAFVLSLPE